MKTVDEILRVMREFADGQEKNGYYDLRALSTDSFRAYADRIEAAVKALEADRDNWRRQALDEDARANATHKDSLAVGDMAAMREALNIVIDSIKAFSKIRALKFPKEVKSALGNMAFHAVTALEKPPRNCDVGSVEEQYARFKKWCEGEFYKRPMNPLTGEPCKSCPCYSVSANGVDGCNYLRWAQMQYEKEGEA